MQDPDTCHLRGAAYPGMERFVLTQLPMPPSSNHQYWNQVIQAGGRSVGKPTPTKELKDFVKAMEDYRQKNLVYVYAAKKKIRGWMLGGFMLHVTVRANFHGTDLHTQKGTPQRMDATNRIKALHDCLADMLEVDDSWFWKCDIEKCETTKAAPWCIVELAPWKPRSVTELKEQERL